METLRKHLVVCLLTISCVLAIALAAARQAEFKPTLESGKPIRVKGTITYNFKLD